jgi:hypothetical protein
MESGSISMTKSIPKPAKLKDVSLKPVLPKNFEYKWNTFTHKCHYAQSKSYIRSHRYSPAAFGWSTGIKCQEHQRRHDHSAQSSNDWQGSLFCRRKFADKQFVFNLQPHDKEKNHHETVIYPVVQQLCHYVIAKPILKRISQRW